MSAQQLVGLIVGGVFSVATGKADNSKWSVRYVARTGGYEEEEDDNEMTIWWTMR